ncbi:MAG: DUF3313 domain-containing protein [Candidatus Binatia bacterium]|nr:DUF3313 domain-containing protein [Candidatus Binatia bacterium]
MLPLLALLGCAASQPASQPHVDTVLIEDGLLRPTGRDDLAQQLYVAPNVDWARYDRILLDPVMIWRDEEEDEGGVSQIDMQYLADYFYDFLHATLAKRYEMVRMPGPGTFRVTVALVRATERSVAPDILSNVIPQARLLMRMSDLISDKPIFVGEAAVETRIVDAETGRLLVAGLDHRVGSRSLSSKSLRSWGHAEHIIEFWSARATYNLCTRQGRADCGPQPSP